VGVGGQRHAPAALSPGKDLAAIEWEVGWVPVWGWWGAENFAPHRDSIPGPKNGVPLIKVHLVTCHERREDEKRYRSTLSLTSGLDGGGWSTPRPSRFTPRERPGTYCIGGWAGPRAGLDVGVKYPPGRDSIPGTSSS
jgi:hypothetical protein